MIKVEEYHLDREKRSSIEELSKKYIEKKERIKLIKNEPHQEKGIPDYQYKKKGKRIFIEFKASGSGLRYSQLKWIIEHPRVLTRVIYVDVWFTEELK